MSTIERKPFGQTKDGREITAFELKNGHGILVRILDFGGTVQRLIVPDRNGQPTDIVLGYEDVRSYEEGTCFYGGIVGRFANRIGGARFLLEGREIVLEKTPGEENHVHGIFHLKVFDAKVEGDTLIFRYFSPAMEEGFPGNLTMEVRCHLSEENELEMNYQATTDETTVVNLTNHSYFNLNGQDGSTVYDHIIRLNSSFYTEYTESFAQSGVITSVDGTPLDFREAHTIGERFKDSYYQLRLCTGYDHNMILDGEEGQFKWVGSAKSEKTGICLDAFTTEPAVQFYSGNHIIYDPELNRKNGVRYPNNGGFCFEAQHYPDSVNHPNFPSTVLHPGEVYRQKTVYRFRTE